VIVACKLPFTHVMARGNRREPIFLDDEDRESFLKALGEASQMTGWEVHAWVLMSNHYHMVIRTPVANLVEGMKWLQNTFTRRFNCRHRKWGRLFGDRYKAVVIEGGEELSFYLETVIDYVHLNSVRAGIISPQRGESVRDFPWSSISRGYALLPSKRPKWQFCEEILLTFGWKDNTAGRRSMVEHLDARAASEEKEHCGVPEMPTDRDRRLSELRRGWYWGSQAFCERMLALVGKGFRKTAARAYKSAPEVKEHGELAARQLLQEALSTMKTEEKCIKDWARGDKRKLALAAILRKRTTVSNQWIAAHLSMGSAANVSQRVRTADLPRLSKMLPPSLRKMLREII